jgi:hypothetical protein
MRCGNIFFGPIQVSDDVLHPMHSIKMTFIAMH